MRRCAVHALLVGFTFLAPLAANAAEDTITKLSGPFLKNPIHFTNVAPNIELITGPGGNILAIFSKDETLLVDNGVPARAEELAKALETRHAAPVKTIVNTHYHFDHTGGNAYFANQGAKILAQSNVKKRLAYPPQDNFFHLPFPPAAEAALPSESFESSIELKRNGTTLRFTHPAAPAHTDGDSFLFIPELNVLHTGDLFSNGVYPFIDDSVGGNIHGMIEATDQLLAVANDKTRIIPGHGKLANKADLRNYRAMLVAVEKNIDALVKAGKTEDQAVAAKPTKKFDKKWGKGFFNGEQFTRYVYRGMLQTTLEGKSWNLSAIRGVTLAAEATKHVPSLVLDTKVKRVSGFSGCNRLMGNYTLSSQNLSFGHLAATRMACLRGMKIEKEFLYELGQVAQWQIRGTTLTLLDGNGKPALEFVTGSANP